MRQLSHENICEFIGANFEAPHPIILTSFAQKGKLQDILANDDIKLDWMFKCSLISDLVNVSYLYISKLIFNPIIELKFQFFSTELDRYLKNIVEV